MNQRKSVESSHPSYPPQLNPALEGVLGCLDIDLEEELKKYRRYRHSQGLSTAAIAGPGTQANLDESNIADPELPSFMSVKAAVESLSPSDTGDQVLPEKTTLQLPLGEEFVGTSNSPTELPPTNNQGESSTIEMPDSYLESSEKLLETLEKNSPESAPITPVNPPQKIRLFTPIGVSAMLIFLISCTTLSYFLWYQMGWRWLELNSLSSTTTKQEPTTPPTTPPTTVSNNQPILPVTPNLVEKEFVDLNVGNLSLLKGRPTPIPSPLPKPVIPPNISGTPIAPSQPISPGESDKVPGLDNLTKALLPSPTPEVKPTQIVATPKANINPKTTPTPTQIIEKPVRSKDGLYYIGLDYTGESSLTKARQIVPDAFIIKTSKGDKISLGALTNSGAAEKLVKELQKKGISPKYFGL